MPPDALLVQRWLDKGDHDRSAATRLFTPGCTELAIIGFLCQQAIEKYLKAFSFHAIRIRPGAMTFAPSPKSVLRSTGTFRHGVTAYRP